MFKQLFLFKPVKVDKYEQKLFFSTSEPHISKPFLCVVLRHFGEFLREIFFLDIKLTISEGALKYSESLFLLACLKGENPDENLDLFK